MVPFVYIRFVIFITLNIVNAIEVIDGIIKISIVTTAGCEDTTTFISKQLEDTYREHRSFLKVEFVPWGRTSYKKDGTISCQFGPSDCWANRVHRCALAMLSDQDAQVEYMICEFTSPFSSFKQGRYFCAKSMGIHLYDLDYCVTTPAGEYLDNAAEETARLPMKFINFVPAIYFNDIVNDLKVHNWARKNLKSMVCNALADDPSTGVTDCEPLEEDEGVLSYIKKEVMKTLAGVGRNFNSLEE